MVSVGITAGGKDLNVGTAEANVPPKAHYGKPTFNNITPNG